MIIVTFRISTVPGKQAKGLEWAKKTMAATNKGGFAASKWWILRPRSGEGSRFTIAAQFASLADYEKITAKGNADSGFQAFGRERDESDWYTGIETIIAEVVEEG